MKHHLKASATGLILSMVFLQSEFSHAADPTLKIGGRIMLDYTSADVKNPDSSIEDHEIRRARLNISGKLTDQIKYKVEINKSTGDPVLFEDAWIQFTPMGSKIKIKAGQMVIHNSLDEQNSSRFMSVLERAAFTDAFGFSRRVGLSVGTSGENYTFNIGAFGSNIRQEGNPKEGYAFAGRGTYNPVKTDDMLVHLGASWRYRSKGDDGSDLRYRQRPYTHVAPSRIINTGRFAESDNFLGVEAAMLSGPFWVAGEYAALSANGNGTNIDGDFKGFYGEAGIFFGGKKTYKGGKFNRPKVNNPVGKGGYGALSLVARFDQLDLQDAAYLGKLDTMILGADWYPTKNTRVGINFFDSDAENGSADKVSGFLARLHYDF